MDISDLTPETHTGLAAFSNILRRVGRREREVSSFGFSVIGTSDDIVAGMPVFAEACGVLFQVGPRLLGAKIRRVDSETVYLVISLSRASRWMTLRMDVVTQLQAPEETVPMSTEWVYVEPRPSTPSTDATDAESTT